MYVKHLDKLQKLTLVLSLDSWEIALKFWGIKLILDFQNDFGQVADHTRVSYEVSLSHPQMSFNCYHQRVQFESLTLTIVFDPRTKQSSCDVVLGCQMRDLSIHTYKFLLSKTVFQQEIYVHDIHIVSPYKIKCHRDKTYLI